MEQMEQAGMAEIFYDNGTLFLALPYPSGLSAKPYWATFLEIGRKCDDLRIDEAGNWAFFDQDSQLIGIQMEDPIDHESGAPKESVLRWLRQLMEEHQVVTFIETMQSCHEQCAKEEPGDEGEVLSFQIGPEGPTGSSPANTTTSTGRWLGRVMSRLSKAIAAARAAKNGK